jgi:hypothetical protein
MKVFRFAAASALAESMFCPVAGTRAPRKFSWASRCFFGTSSRPSKSKWTKARPLAQIIPIIPQRDRNRIPNDLSTDIAIIYAEITQRRPAGALPHKWKVTPLIPVPACDLRVIENGLRR